jgi:hypothetical protein
MDHAYIEENGLVESYHRGLLPPEEEARFEAHFAGCPQCVEQLELARGFQRGLKAMAAEDLERTAQIAQTIQRAAALGLFAWLARRGRAVQWGLALAALLLAAALPALLMTWGMAGGARQQDAERRALQARVAAQEQSRRELAGRLAASEARLAQVKPQAPTAPPRGLAAPLTNTPVFLLSLLRGEEGKPAAIDLSRTGDALALAVDVGAGGGFTSYRATVIRGGGSAVFERAGLKPNALEALMITFPASFFTAGDYRLKIEGVRADGAASAVGEYGFRVLGKVPGKVSGRVPEKP